MAEIQEYKCPNCGGAVTFDSTLQKMKCPYCDSEFEIDALKEHDQALKQEPKEDMNWKTSEAQWQEGETEGICSYVCKSCGGEIVGDGELIVGGGGIGRSDAGGVSVGRIDAGRSGPG